MVMVMATAILMGTPTSMTMAMGTTMPILKKK
jgi:hypothetical protein